MENFYSDFESITYVRTFRELKLRYDAHRDKRERILSARSVEIIRESLRERERNVSFVVRQRVVHLDSMRTVSYPSIVFEKTNVISMLTKKIGSTTRPMKIDSVRSIMEQSFKLIPTMMTVNRISLVQYQAVNQHKKLVNPTTTKTKTATMTNWSHQHVHHNVPNLLSVSILDDRHKRRNHHHRRRMPW